MRLKLPINVEMSESVQVSSHTRSDEGQMGEGRFFKEVYPSSSFNGEGENSDFGWSSCLLVQSDFSFANLNYCEVFVSFCSFIGTDVELD